MGRRGAIIGPMAVVTPSTADPPAASRVDGRARSMAGSVAGWSMVTVLALEALWLWALCYAIVLIAT
jgi:hypothetical protein